MARIAIIGGGSIGEALLSGLLRAGRQVKDLVVAEKDPARAKYLSDTYSVLVTTVADAAENASFVIVAVKPADVRVGRSTRSPTPPPTPKATASSRFS